MAEHGHDHAPASDTHSHQNVVRSSGAYINPLRIFLDMMKPVSAKEAEKPIEHVAGEAVEFVEGVTEVPVEAVGLKKSEGKKAAAHGH